MKRRKNSVANRLGRRRNQPKSIAPLSSCGLSSEVLENRELLSISLVGTVLTIVGTANNDVSAVTVFTDGQGTKFHATMNAEQFDVLVGSVASISFSGLNGDDQFTNSSGAGGAVRPSTASGGSGVDTLTGSSGVDTLNGDDGNDSLHGGLGDDVLSGGNNNDSIYGQVGNDSLTGGAGDDALNGFDGNDFYYGGDGSDNMIGGIGDDTYNFGIPSASETDTVVEAASAGSDYLYFGGVTAAVTVNIGSTNGTVATHTNRTVSATSTSAANLEIVHGGTGNDSITGNASANNLSGAAGNDYLYGLAGNDYLYGNGGDDTYSFVNPTGTETDTVIEQSGEGSYDFLYFGGITAVVTVDIGSTNGTVATHTNRTVSATSTSAANLEIVRGGTGNDSINGNAANNSLNGGEGNDLIHGRTGNDTLYGGTGNDLLWGDAGNDSLYGDEDDDTYYFLDPTGTETDTVIEDSGEGTFDHITFGGITSAVTINLGSTSGTVATHSNRTVTATSTSCANLESATGSGGGDTITGNASNNILDGNSGSDTLTGGNGNDVYKFSTATATENDVVVEAAGGGSDELNFGLMTTAVTVNLGSTTVATHTNRTVTATTTSAANLEWVTGSKVDDSITGNATGNTLVGGFGHDSLYGMGGNDFLIGDNNNHTETAGDIGDDLLDGGANNDTILGEAGNDSLVGGSGDDLYKFYSEWIEIGPYVETDMIGENQNGGTDRLDFSESNGVDINLGISLIGNFNPYSYRSIETLSGYAVGQIEDVVGSQFVDTITGSSSVNLLIGGDGNDNLYGAGGADTLQGGNGKDRLFGGKDSAADSLVGGADADRFLVPSTATAYDGSGLFATAFTYEDSSTDLALEDAEFRLYGQQATTIEVAPGVELEFDPGSWTDTDILNVDSALEKLHLEVAGAELLQNVLDTNHQPIGKLGAQTSGPGTLYGYNMGYFSGESSLGITLTGNAFANMDQLRSTTIHEMGHNFDSPSENAFIDDFRDLSNWQFSGGQWTFGANPGFAHASADDNPFEDFAYTFDSYFMDKYWDNPLGRTLVQDKLDNVQDFLDSLS